MTSPDGEDKQCKFPVPSLSTSFSSRQAPVPIQATSGNVQDLRRVDNPASLPGPGQSMIASALQENLGRSPPRLGTPPRRTESPALLSQPVRSNYGSFDNKLGREGSIHSTAPFEDPEVVRRHLVQPQNVADSNNIGDVASNADEDFSSLQLQGGDITRQVYRWAEDAESGSSVRKPLRSKSFSLSRPTPEQETMDINSIRIPGGFRRDFIRRTVGSPHPENSNSRVRAPTTHNPLHTSSFLEFLTLYGHFAGEELEDDDEVLGPDEYFSSEPWDETEDREPGEESALLRPETPGRRKRKPRGGTGTNTVTGAALLLLKSFVGTGVLFLPRAFLNGGMLFSSLVLLAVSLLSFYCFILLVNTRLKIEGSFGDIGGALFGKHMRRIILGSIVLSQLGFVSAYIVFTAENLQAFVLAVSKCKSFIDIKFMVLMQLVIFLPLSLIRDIGKLGFTALVADVFILLGLIYLYYYDVHTIVSQGGISDIKAFNPSTWTLFIGTAIFTYEGIGLIIPIQESMKQPHRFPGVLAGVMVLITIVFLSAGALSYAAYGSATQTVVILNLPQDDKFVNAVQFLYSLAILLSTPLQLFPAIRIMENELFTRSGKYNPGIKWKKNCFRFFLVMICAFVAWGGADDLDKFVSLVGSFACVPLIYVYPPLLHLKACAQSRRQQIADIALACLGVVSCIYTTTLTIYNWVGADDTKPPGYCDSGSV
ncbi:putative amino acid transporter [Aspergillus clavatus NRRL 1]|uniref:Amino acid transporter, putative n=1 Tax=Aspergillus clavatus (strain ATCC 1007 / CBS 513.65 / DSM 816 / NCTC 3887 / NRRL 1 / QM 1276 / 107) TaxID=344612 RepID=A1CH89_ASPCL|nr:amino acid transporter, putative [Aspergillus clavatus NRRL 1]EAW10244.1 amino acid transporter, putative [Aspergillus clavatus NRRL 1]